MGLGLPKNLRKINATVTLTFSSPNQLETIFHSLLPETKSIAMSRTSTSISKTDNSILLIFDAYDLSSLRASMNSYLSWAASLHRLMETISILKKKTSNS
jgi:KEOPS complex subunit Pcc1